jgi:hypothetical protein
MIVSPRLLQPRIASDDFVGRVSGYLRIGAVDGANPPIAIGNDDRIGRHLVDHRRLP